VTIPLHLPLITYLEALRIATSGNPLVAIGPKVVREVKLRWSGFTSHLPVGSDYDQQAAS
jgi:hypothetical protein